MPFQGSRCEIRSPRFSRHVEAVFSRLGCNAGTCHGAVKVQNGFRLSLFASDPVLDHERIVREAAGRRINLLDPDASLLLLPSVGFLPPDEPRMLGTLKAIERASPADLAKVEGSVAVMNEDFESAMGAMAKLRPAVDAFFEHVKVNDDDLKVRENRLKLLNEIRAATRAVADFSRIQD